LVAGETLSSGMDPQRLYADVHQSVRAAIPSAGGYYDIYYSFELFDMYIDLWDGYGLNAGINEYVAAKIGYDLWWEGSPLVWSWERSLLIAENGDFDALARKGDWGEAGYTVTAGPDGRLRIDYEPLVLTDFLVGTVRNNEDGYNADFELHSRLYAQLILPAGLDLGGEAGISDPFDISHAVPGARLKVERVQGNPVVPTPATLALLSLGLAGIGYQRLGKNKPE
jgi:hypothetical protein